jgi:hypothetical protein
MTWDEGSRYDASRVGLWETAAVMGTRMKAPSETGGTSGRLKMP